MRNKISIILSLCVIFNFFSSQNLMAQRKKKGNEAAVAGAAVLGGLIASKIAIEEIKEQLEADAVTHIISNYPEINEFIGSMFAPASAMLKRYNSKWLPYPPVGSESVSSSTTISLINLAA